MSFSVLDIITLASAPLYWMWLMNQHNPRDDQWHERMRVTWVKRGTAFLLGLYALMLTTTLFSGFITVVYVILASMMILYGAVGRLMLILIPGWSRFYLEQPPIPRPGYDLREMYGVDEDENENEQRDERRL